MLVSSLACVVLATTYFSERFDDMSKWTHTKASGKDGVFDLAASKFAADPNNKGLRTSQDAKFYAISAPFDKPFSNKDKDLVFQFSVAHPQSIDCGGGYIKLLPKTDPTKFEGESPYYLMFGPDICGYTKRIHNIISKDGKNHLWTKEPTCESDQLTHVYTLHIKPDNTYTVLVDGEKKESGSLEEDWSIVAPKEIDDPNDKKPSDWTDDPEMDDPEDVKPADWDTEPETIPDKDAKQPDDWDAEEDGAWEPPMIANPKHKGEWKAKRIANPKYKGPWSPKKIANPDHKPRPDLYSFDDIATVGIDLWQVKSGTIFDDIIVTDSLKEAEDFRKDWEKSKSQEKANKEKADKADADAASKAAESSKDDAKSADKDDDDEDSQ